MQQVAEALGQRRRLGYDFFGPGHRGKPISETVTEYRADLPGLLLAFHRWQERDEHRNLRLRLSSLPVISIEEARAHLQYIAGTLQQWKPLHAVVPQSCLSGAGQSKDDETLLARSRLASTFVAGLEMQREGDLCLRQEDLSSDIEVKSASG
jgi:chromatin segregation and condensation protein Rec8/ScpA/Scc1 (kleisin family)